MASQNESGSDGAPPGSVNLASLSLPQLRSLQTRLTSELEHLTTSHAKLRAAQAKFRDCVNSINDGVTGSESKGTTGRDEILVPLTSSLYVKGRLTDREKVLVDVGTGFYVEKVCFGLFILQIGMEQRSRSYIFCGTLFFATCRKLTDQSSMQTPEKAIAFYNDKVKGLDENLVELEKIVQAKNSQLRIVEEVLRQKMLSGEGAEAGAPSA
ncbi:hypothetical protein N7478_005150 [Penicillium angulare]|uniref:uncharacterized protein n=1 Tax=Penicillium angulare TaxID=116970 RepID=UPI0025404D15|nr:uncharacterized protein N7478_005150 [Penicillium angulare]KAJ5279778.1 hypothetical protein N7478_005150 [Penicillium angulare]